MVLIICPLVLQTNMATLQPNFMVRFDAKWITNLEFNELVHKWWVEFKLNGDIGQCWHQKLKHMRKNKRLAQKI
jgi:hypothetical protein